MVGRRGGTTQKSILSAGDAFAQVAQTPAPRLPAGGVAVALDCFVPRNDERGGGAPPSIVTVRLPLL